MNYEKTFFGGILLEEDELRNNNIYRNIEIEYYKIAKELKTLFHGKKKTYGIEVVMREYANDEMKIQEERIISWTKNEEIVEKILKKLKENAVTPTTLNDVITDMFY